MPYSLKAAAAAAPAPWFVTGLGIVASLVTGLGHFSPSADAVIFSLATAAGTLLTAAMARPVAVTVIGGAAAVVLGDFAIFGLHLSSDATGAVVAAVTFALGLALHAAHVQAAAPLR